MQTDDTDLCGDLCISVITEALGVFIWLLQHLDKYYKHFIALLLHNFILTRNGKNLVP